MKTPQLPYPALARALGLKNEVWIKREDKHPYGSHKGRSIPLMIDRHRKEGRKHFVISSSGNAAIAAARTVKNHNKNNPGDPISLDVFIGRKIAPGKREILFSETSGEGAITIRLVPAPKQAAVSAARAGGQLLRQSTDPAALLGYHELAKELGSMPNLAAVFVPASSGATAQGLHEGFKNLGFNPEIHIVQTTSCHPFVPGDAEDEKSLADAIVDRVGYRRSEVAAALKNSRGSGWIAKNRDIEKAKKLLESIGIHASPNGALSLAGLMLAKESGKSWTGPVAILLTGP